MADLGTITTAQPPAYQTQKTSVWWAWSPVPLNSCTVPPDSVVAKRELPYYPGPKILMDHSGTIAGWVKDGDTPVPAVRVVLFHRQSCVVVAVAYTDDTGEFSFDGLYPDANAYFVMAFYPNGEVSRNALVFDKITPA